MNTATTTGRAESAPDPLHVAPASRSAGSWAGRLAVLKSRGVPDDDPRVIECRESLAYHRVRRTLDAERDNLSADHLPELRDLLAHPHALPGGRR